MAAGAAYGNFEVILVDNGSTDGSSEILKTFQGRARVIEHRPGTVAAVRNQGVAHASGEYLSFIDADCTIEPTYYTLALQVFDSVAPAATGCRYDLPPNPHWIEEVWQIIHRRPKDGYVNYLNSGNLVVRKSAFEAVGGFDESLETGEDAELGQRLGRHGFRIYESHAVAAVHLGNPKTLRAFFRKHVWHGLGMFGTVNRTALDKPLIMTFCHLFLTGGAILTLQLSRIPPIPRLLCSLALMAGVPVASVAYRAVATRRVYRPVRAALLYWIYYMARLKALQLLTTAAVRSSLR